MFVPPYLPVAGLGMFSRVTATMIRVERVERVYRPVAAVGEDGTALQQAVRRIGRVEDILVDVAFHAVDRVHVPAGPLQMHAGNDPELAEARQVGGVDELHVSHRVAAIPALVRLLDGREVVERCVTARLPMACTWMFQRFASSILKPNGASSTVGSSPRRVPGTQTGALGRADVDVVGLEHRGRLRRELGHAVGEDLRRVHGQRARAGRAGVAVVLGPRRVEYVDLALQERRVGLPPAPRRRSRTG